MHMPDVRPIAADLVALTGKPIANVEVISRGRWFKEVPRLRWVKPGDPFSAADVRSAVRDLLDTGRIANASIEATVEQERVYLKIYVEPRRIVSKLTVVGAALPEELVLELAGLKLYGDIADSDVQARADAIRMLHVQRGYPRAVVVPTLYAGEDAASVHLMFTVTTGGAVVIARRRFEVEPDPNMNGLKSLLGEYSAKPGDRYDEPSLLVADRALGLRLRQAGYHDASVTHVASVEESSVLVRVLVRAGPRVRIGFEGNLRFDSEALAELLELETTEDRSVEVMAERLRKHYISYGFLDVRVKIRQLEPNLRERNVTFVISEGEKVRVTRREYPCLSGQRSASDVNAEIDSFLAEELPGADLLGAIDSKSVDRTVAPTGQAFGRAELLHPNPYETYSSRVYERAIKHLQDLYRSEGYLSATVGPAAIVRRTCARGTPPGECRPLSSKSTDVARCLVDDQGKLLEEPPPDAQAECIPDPLKGKYCESTAVVQIPIKLGPRTTLWDVTFDGEKRLTPAQLGQVAALELGAPLSLSEVEQARRRVLDEYTERGFAYADVSTQIDMSPDHSRGAVRFMVREGEPVRISNIYVKGASTVSEPLIRSRIALQAGKPYRRSLVRATEERLGTLGVFSTVRVGLEDPYVPAREKNVVVEVTERVPQYFEWRGGFSTGEGPRLRAEFGNINVGGKAIQFALRVRLSYLPDALILEPDVRRKYESEVANPWERLERTVGLSATFPNIGLGPLFRLGAEAFDVHDNARDFALTKDAAVTTLSHLTTRRLTLQVGTSLERNNVRVFGQEDQVKALQDYVEQNPGRSMIFRVPAGTTGVIAERFTVSWDRRDVPLDAHRGTFVTSTIEHVTAKPLYENRSTADSIFRPTDSQFLRLISRVSGYIPLSKKGATFALSFRFGINHQLTKGSRTYPDRLFFMGGMDSVRGFLQDSMIPEDMAVQVLHNRNVISAATVPIRGGNFFVNPRSELRLPIMSNLQTVIFVDAGNVWSRSPTEPSSWGTGYRPNYTRLRYATGTGLRVGTPIGPLVFDYGFNIERAMNAFFPKMRNKRTWEDLGAFHFSIGVF